MQDWLGLILAFPLAGVLVNGLLGRWLPCRAIGVVACASIGLAFAAALRCFFPLALQGRTLSQVLFTWVPVGDFRVEFGLLLDPLSAVMAVTVSGVAFLIHIYSLGYMAHDRGYRRYFVELNLFTFSMLLLVLADNFLVLYVGWELVGLCSYLLISFWHERPAAASAGKKAFIVNRIGDMGFAVAVLLIFLTFGSLSYADVFPSASQRFSPGDATMLAIALLLFVGATGKSAQIPLYVWLPDAMEGPTPVSALIHAATMVTAGVYMVARCSAIYALAPVAMDVVAVIGLATAFLAATMAMAQYDIKRVLAYSTISQLGLMFLACGVGAFDAGIFHLFTHAFFKALLFLCAGSVMHALAGEADMRRLGGLWRRLPVTFGTFLVATLAIVGCPPFAGFFSKDEVLAAAFHGPHGHPVLGVAAMLVAAMTAFYMFRLLCRVFLGECRADEGTLSHAHESPPSMTIPLMILAAFSLIAGCIDVPGIVDLHSRTRDVVLLPLPSIKAAEWPLILASVVVAALGAAAAWVMYVSRPRLAGSLAARWPRLVSLLRNKWYVDEAYDALFVQPSYRLALWLWRVVDMGLIDGGANGIRWLVETASELGRRLQVGYIRGYATAFALGVVVLLWWLLLN